MPLGRPGGFGRNSTPRAAASGQQERLALVSRVLTEGSTRDVSNEESEAVGLEFDGRDMAEDAAERLYEYPLRVEATTTFEVVLGAGGPGDRLCLECDGCPADWQPDLHTPPPTVYGPLRPLPLLLVGRAGLRLRGEDREVAEAFAL